MFNDAPDHHDADLILKLYDLRREAVMRESRTAINAKFKSSIPLCNPNNFAGNELPVP